MLEAVRSFRLRLHGQVRTVERGQALIELDREDAEKLLAKAPDLVRVLSTIRWCSPLFGNLRGDVLMTDGEQVLVDHPIIGEPAWISRSWIIVKENHARHN